MNYWTNIRIPERFDSRRKLDLEIGELYFKLNAKQEECNLLYNELENIFVALKSGNTVTMKYDKDSIEVSIIKCKEG